VPTMAAGSWRASARGCSSWEFLLGSRSESVYAGRAARLRYLNEYICRCVFCTSAPFAVSREETAATGSVARCPALIDRHHRKNNPRTFNSLPSVRSLARVDGSAVRTQNTSRVSCYVRAHARVCMHACILRPSARAV
jgi:hypothetical protein